MIPRINGELHAADGVTLKYSIFGDHGSWLVMVHGYQSSAYLAWIRTGIAKRLAERHRVVVFDCRNHGISGHPQPGGRGIPRDVVDLMDNLGIGRAHLHGHCMGASIVITLVGAIPDRILTASVGSPVVPEVEEVTACGSVAWDKVLTQPSGCIAAVNLASVHTPILALSWPEDAPEQKLARMQRKLRHFRSIVFPEPRKGNGEGLGLYTAALAQFIDEFDDAADAGPLQALGESGG